MVYLFKKLFNKYKSVFWFSGFLILYTFYFLSKHIPKNYYVLHFALDDKIPFLPIFIIPYIIWYLYVPLPMIYMFFKNGDAFKKQAITFFSGAIFCALIFLIFPTIIDFRPTAEGKGMLLWLTRIIYANDVPPANCFPSLHCYEALAIHLTTFTFGPYKNKKGLRISSFVLMVIICASTVFVKQHSYVDIIGGCIIAIITCFVANRIFKGNKNGLDT